MSLAVYEDPTSPHPPRAIERGMKIRVTDKDMPFLVHTATVTEVHGRQLRVSIDDMPHLRSYWVNNNTPVIRFLTAEPQAESPCRAPPAAARPPALPAPARPPTPQPTAGPLTPPAPARPIIIPSSARPIIIPSPARPIIIPSPARPIIIPSPARPIIIPTPAKPLVIPGPSRPLTPPTPARPLTPVPPAEPLTPPVPFRPPTTGVAHHASEKLLKHLESLALPHNPILWTQSDVSALVTRIAGTSAGTAVAAARMSGPELLMASREELVECLHLRLGPAIKVYSAIRQLRERANPP